ncbi:hypothetical protein LMG28727_06402 [Paraburkholderia kirstenboschensis]|nr:hypothetical protein LMG28727_06402 [Paraburkholderia kirstenboschensis]
MTTPLLLIMPPNACNCSKFTASVPFVPFATLTIWRSEPTAPTDTVLARLATEFEPNATEFVADALAAPPIATVSVPVADESASVEFVWKYLMPPPLTMLLTVLVTFVRLPATFATVAFV